MSTREWVGLICDRHGRVRSVLCDGLDLGSRLAPDRALPDVVSDSSRGDAWAFLIDVQAERRVVGRPLDVPAGSGTERLFFSGGAVADGVLVLAQRTPVSEEVLRAEMASLPRAGSHPAELVDALGEERLRLLSTAVEAAADGIAISDPHGVAVWVNPGFTRLTGYSREEVVGKNLRLLKSGKHDAAFYADMWGTIAAGRIWQGEMVNRRKDGALYAEQQTITPVLDDGGRITHFIAIKQDASERERAREADEANRAKSLFLANMSHEIRTPLTGIVGTLEALIGTSLDARQRGFVEIAQGSADLLLRVINDILDLSKVEAGRIDLEAVDFDLAETLERVIAPLSVSAAQKGVELSRAVEADVPRRLRGDSLRLSQVLTNLLGNAIKFTAEGDVSLTVRAEREEAGRAHLLFEVTDTGIGLEPEAVDRLFEAFSQADGSTTRRYGGSGLGLSIAKHLVELMGGEIGVESSPGRGSRFWFKLALEVGAAPASEPVDPQAMALRGRVLLVDDTSVNRSVGKTLLEGLGLSVSTAAGGAEAFEVSGQESFDLLLLDCQMPEVDGLEATRRIRARESRDGGTRVPIVALTAGALKGDRERCLAAGMDGYLPKPYTRRQLVETLGRWLEAQPSPSPGSFLDLDSEALESRRARFGAKFDVVVDHFQRESKELVADLRLGLEAGDAERVRRAAHTLKGVAGSLCATGLAERCRLLEEAADGRRGVLLEEIERSLGRVLEELRRPCDGGG